MNRRAAVVWVATGLVGLGIVEYGLRAYKSLTFDGVLHLSTPSINNQRDPRFGWISPPGVSFEKHDACYGSGRITYNEAGFRARPLAEARAADVVVCVLGDSTMQGFQLPDGHHLPHLLEAELRKTYRDPYVLPLAVGGYGTLQEWMLFEQYCQPLHPAAVVLHWDANDATNNSYLADRYSGAANNAGRARPYWEDGAIVMRYPYPLHVAGVLDELMIFKIANTFLLGFSKRSQTELDGYLEQGFAVADQLAHKLAAATAHPIVLMAPGQDHAATLFRAAGFRVVVHEPIPDALTCKPRDSHPTGEGHALMLRALLPAVREALGGR